MRSDLRNFHADAALVHATIRSHLTMYLAYALLALVSSLVLNAPVYAQTIPFSQRGMVAQTVGFTEIVVRYGRPVARGRALFGDSAIVRWDRIWHPGADSATLIAFDKDVQVEGRAVKAGEYTIWLRPRASGAWTFILSRAAHVFHTPYPGEAHDALRLEIAPERGAHMETLAIYFPVVLRDDAVLRIHWGETMVPIKITAPYRPPA
ncbi:MAG: DUF2911 domain-containing protein [Gemmatimonadaceae bacterium]